MDEYINEETNDNNVVEENPNNDTLEDTASNTVTEDVIENEENTQVQEDNASEENVNKEEEKPRELLEYEKIDERLKEIEEKISNENLDMDESIDLYEEAVNLGIKASQTIENNVLYNASSSNQDDDNNKQDRQNDFSDINKEY